MYDRELVAFDQRLQRCHFGVQAKSLDERQGFSKRQGFASRGVEPVADGRHHVETVGGTAKEDDGQEGGPLATLQRPGEGSVEPKRCRGRGEQAFSARVEETPSRQAHWKLREAMAMAWASRRLSKPRTEGVGGFGPRRVPGMRRWASAKARFIRSRREPGSVHSREVSG